MKEPRSRHYLLFEPRNKIRLSISRTLSKKGLSFLEGRYPWPMPELHMKFPGRKRNERVGCRKRSTRELNECRELTVYTAALRIGWSTHIAWYCATLQNLRSWCSQHLHFRVALWKGWGSSQLPQHCNVRVDYARLEDSQYNISMWSLTHPLECMPLRWKLQFCICFCI